jgi:hypothetical protein
MEEMPVVDTCADLTRTTERLEANMARRRRVGDIVRTTTLAETGKLGHA